MLLLYFVMMLVATPLTMGFSLGQNRFCYMCGGSRGARGLVFTGFRNFSLESQVLASVIVLELLVDSRYVRK